MKLYSHPRSGTNWALALLEQAFYGTRTHEVRVTGHYTARWKVQTTGIHLWGNHRHFNAAMPGPRLYLYRDGRDVALSLWRTKGFQVARPELCRIPPHAIGLVGNAGATGARAARDYCRALAAASGLVV